jgi:predicted transcriptional regulator
MRMANRTRFEMLCDILNAATTPVTRTKLMYKAFLPQSQVQEATAFLIRKGLVQFEPLDQTFATTQKGRQTLEKVQTLREMLVVV